MDDPSRSPGRRAFDDPLCRPAAGRIEKERVGAYGPHLQAGMFDRGEMPAFMHEAMNAALVPNVVI